VTTREGCHRPRSSAFATETGAAFAALRVQIPVGKILTPCRCACGWWHLTATPRTVPQPDLLTPRPGDGTLLTDASNTALVEAAKRDVRGTGSIGEALALRHPANLTRWRRALKELWRDVERQFAQRAGDTSETACDWRVRASVYRAVIAERRAEAKERMTRAAQLTAEQRYQWRCAEEAAIEGRDPAVCADVVGLHAVPQAVAA
jgi:hypothetical protein